jgi:hypothetical protein
MQEQNKQKTHQSEYALTAEQLAALLEAKLERARRMHESFRQSQLAKQLA